MDYDVGKKIRERRSELGLTQEQLGARAGMTKLTISRYEGGKRKPGFDELTILSVALEVSPAYFWSGKRSMVPQGARPGIVRIPLLPVQFAACCGRGNGYQEGLMAEDLYIDVTDDVIGSAHDDLRPVFAIRAEGDSMTGAGILEGTTLIINPADETPTGCVALLRVGDNFMIKRLQWQRDGGVVLLSDGRETSRLEFSKDDLDSGYVWVCGRVTGTLRKM